MKNNLEENRDKVRDILEKNLPMRQKYRILGKPLKDCNFELQQLFEDMCEAYSLFLDIKEEEKKRDKLTVDKYWFKGFEWINIDTTGAAPYCIKQRVELHPLPKFTGETTVPIPGESWHKDRDFSTGWKELPIQERIEHLEWEKETFPDLWKEKDEEELVSLKAD